MKNPLQASGGIFDKHDIEAKLKELEKTLLKENFWKDKELVKKTVKQKKIFEEIIVSYENSISEIKNLKELFDLATHEKDTGSSEVQIALLTEKIDSLSKHVKQFKKDKHSSVGLLKAVNRRKKLLDYLKKYKLDSYKNVLTKLNLRK